MRAEKAWPESTFEWDGGNRAHYCGSHWDPFFDSPDEVLGALPEMIPSARPISSFGDTYSGPYKVPGAWPTGTYLCWPNANQGLIATLGVTEGKTELINISPFAGNGIQIGVEIKRVHVWSNGAEAQIEGIWGESVLSFFDLTFLRNRPWYEAGKRREFVLAGVAYEARPSPVENLILDPPSSLPDCS